jgi:hypothetical protein
MYEIPNTCCRVVFRAACSLWCWLHARFPLPRPRPVSPGAARTSTREDAEPPHTRCTARHDTPADMDTRHIIRIRALSLRERGSGVCAQGVAVAPSGAAGAEHLAPAGIHASSIKRRRKAERVSFALFARASSVFRSSLERRIWTRLSILICNWVSGPTQDTQRPLRSLGISCMCGRRRITCCACMVGVRG